MSHITCTMSHITNRVKGTTVPPPCTNLAKPASLWIIYICFMDMINCISERFEPMSHITSTNPSPSPSPSPNHVTHHKICHHIKCLRSDPTWLYSIHLWYEHANGPFWGRFELMSHITNTMSHTTNGDGGTLTCHPQAHVQSSPLV
jgi:hypothetical protein